MSNLKPRSVLQNGYLFRDRPGDFGDLLTGHFGELPADLGHLPGQLGRAGRKGRPRVGDSAHGSVHEIVGGSGSGNRIRVVAEPGVFPALRRRKVIRS